MTMVRRGSAGHVGEGNEAYPNVVAVVDDRTRVVRCQDDMQWVVQVRNNIADTTRAWHGVSFCRSRHALMRVLRERGCALPVEILALPEGIIYPELKYGRWTKLAAVKQAIEAAPLGMQQLKGTTEL